MTAGTAKEGSITSKLLEKLDKDFSADGLARLALNAITKTEISSVLSNRNLNTDTLHLFSHKVPMTELKACSQKSSGRCWIFAALNVVRLGMTKPYNLSELELSQPYLFYWDKLEKSNYFLENVLLTLDEPEDGRVFQFLLQNPVQDGGQWDMIVNLVEKYGVLPKNVYGESAHSGNSRLFNWMVTAKLRQFSKELRQMAAAKTHSLAQLRQAKELMMTEIHRIVNIILGSPPKTFDWQYLDKDKVYKEVKGLTPQTFYRQYVEPHVPLSNTISLINDPRNAYNKHYTVKYLGNVWGGKPVSYINVPCDDLKKYAIASIKAGRPVWFGCDVGKFLDRKAGVMALDTFDYQLAFGTNFRNLNKAERLRFAESLMTHAMVFTGVHLETITAADGTVAEKSIRWRVENSWGDENGDKGYYTMTDDWFDEFMYQVVIDKSLIPADLLNLIKDSPVELPPWDPMGSLA